MPEPLRGKALMRAIIDAMHRLGWRVGHFPSMRGYDGIWRTPVAADGKGFPDLLAVRERLIVVEVKGDGDRLRPEQETWLSAFRMAGIEAHVWTPNDWRNGTVEQALSRTSRPVVGFHVAS